MFLDINKWTKNLEEELEIVLGKETANTIVCELEEKIVDCYLKRAKEEIKNDMLFSFFEWNSK